MSSYPDSQPYRTPKLVAQQLGVSSSGLRRLAAIYEGVHGEMPKDSMGGRLWEPQAVARLEAAKALVDAGRVRSVREALERPFENIETELETLPRKLGASEALELVLVELRDLRAQVIALQERQLQAPRDQNAELEEQRRLNNYLLGELQRRRGEEDTETSRHRWWRFWKRR